MSSPNGGYARTASFILPDAVTIEIRSMRSVSLMHSRIDRSRCSWCAIRRLAITLPHAQSHQLSTRPYSGAETPFGTTGTPGIDRAPPCTTASRYSDAPLSRAKKDEEQALLRHHVSETAWAQRWDVRSAANQLSANRGGGVFVRILHSCSGFQLAIDLRQPIPRRLHRPRSCPSHARETCGPVAAWP